MANLKISQLTDGSPVQATDQFPINRAGANFRISGLAPTTSPVLTGTPTAPTAATGDSSTTVATTAFVQASQASITTTGNGGVVIPFDTPFMTAGGVTNPNPNTTDDSVITERFIIREKLIVNHLTIAVTTASSGGSMYVAIYSANGNTKITSAGPFSLATAAATTGTAVTAVPSGAPITLLPGNYILAFTTEGESVPGTARVSGVSAGQIPTLVNKNAVNFGTAANPATSGGIFPPTLGAITALPGSASVGLVAVFAEP